MKQQLMCSLLATFEGINPTEYYPCDSYARHMLPLPEHGLTCTNDEISSQSMTAEFGRVSASPQRMRMRELRRRMN